MQSGETEPSARKEPSAGKEPSACTEPSAGKQQSAGKEPLARKDPSASKEPSVGNDIVLPADPSSHTEAPTAEDIDQMLQNARDATDFLKAMAHEGRLIILCRLAQGECPVSELENMLSARQAAVSQQLARLRLEGLVTTRREGKTIYYAIKDERVKKMIEVVYDLFCQ